MRRISVFLLLFLSYCYSCYSQQLAFFNIIGFLVPTSDSIAQPVHSLSVSIKDYSKGLLRWKCDSTANESFFSIEKSINGVDFNTIGITKNSTKGWFEFLDEGTLKGKLFYRIKLTIGQTMVYSSTVSFVLAGDVSCKFYPNPVDKILIVRSEMGVDLKISNTLGKSLISEHLLPGLKIIDVSSLEPGIYDIVLFEKDNNKLVVEKITKK